MARSTYEEEVISKIAARTPQQWRSAFLKLWDEHKITKNQRKILCVHYEAPRHTLGQAAVACGRRGRQQTADSGMLWALAPLRESDFHTSAESHDLTPSREDWSPEIWEYFCHPRNLIRCQTQYTDWTEQ